MPETGAHIDVVIAAAYALARAGLRAVVEADTRLHVVSEVVSAAELSQLQSNFASVVLIDYSEPQGRAMIDASLAQPSIGILLLGPPASEAGNLISHVSDGRGFGMLSKEAERFAITSAILAVGSGLVVLDPAFVVLSDNAASAPFLLQSPVSARSSDAEPLSARERQVLQSVAQGMPNKQIAVKLGISQHTVKFHIASILSKLGAASRTEAVMLGARRGDVTV